MGRRVPAANFSRLRDDFVIGTVIDALEAVELSRPDDFDSGIVAVLLDAERRPLVAVAIDGAPSNDLHRIAELLTSTPQDRLAAIAFGIVRSENSAPTGQDDAGARFVQRIDDGDLVSWAEAARTCSNAGVEVVDVLVLEPGGWFAVSEARGSDVSGK
jgi:hypothetical protein